MPDHAFVPFLIRCCIPKSCDAPMNDYQALKSEHIVIK